MAVRLRPCFCLWGNVGFRQQSCTVNVGGPNDACIVRNGAWLRRCVCGVSRRVGSVPCRIYLARRDPSRDRTRTQGLTPLAIICNAYGIKLQTLLSLFDVLYLLRKWNVTLQAVRPAMSVARGKVRGTSTATPGMGVSCV